MISFIKALWAAFMAFFASRKQDQHEAQQHAQEVQDQIMEETQNEIDQIPGKNDDDLLDTAIDTGLVQSKNPSRSFRPGNGTGPGYSYHTGSKAPRKTKE